MEFTSSNLKKAKAKRGMAKYKNECVKELQFLEAELNSMIVSGAKQCDIDFKRINIKYFRDSIVDMLADY
ncbi:hypothetical protein ACQ31_gp064 [Salmonella phage STML-198]|nr:hypothetical protein ACQ31_gp064 [Salmonella phage STML-198]YP_009615747.1 hypothetical protein FDI73_gp129 [Salmonella phage Melville]AFU63947.1 hypothetical protein [Salmonella phage STML-198]ATN93235.1 hypothetical protein CPT_Melville_272 [Salmonella phage Melville]UPW42371.1 hypothetical protein EBPHNEJP_00073 [Salmonella phage CF-SP2]